MEESQRKGRQLRGSNLRPRLRVSKLQWAFITQNGYYEALSSSIRACECIDQ